MENGVAATHEGKPDHTVAEETATVPEDVITNPAVPIDGPPNQDELNLGIPDTQRRLINALGVLTRINRGERVELHEVSAQTHGPETVVFVRRALRGKLTEL